MTSAGNENASPSRFEDATLYAFIDGETDPQTAAAIAASPADLARAERLRREQRRLRSAFHRIDCPEVDVLLDHAAGWLEPARAREVDAHVESCPRCAEEVAQIASFRDEIAQADTGSIADRLRSIVATLVSGPGLGFAGAPAVLRGGGDNGGNGGGVGGGSEGAEPWIFEAGAVMLTLAAGRDARRAERFELSGQVTGADATGWWAAVFADDPEPATPDEAADAARGVSAPTSTSAPDTARSPGEAPPLGDPVASTEVDALSTFAISGLAPGRYRLILRGDDRRIEVDGIELA